MVFKVDSGYGKWNDAPCSYLKPFICQQTPGMGIRKIPRKLVPKSLLQMKIKSTKLFWSPALDGFYVDAEVMYT